MNMEMPQNFKPKFEVQPINIDKALNLIENLESKLSNQESLSKDDSEEIDYMIETLQGLQNNGITDPAIATALTKIISLREDLTN